MFLKRLFLLGGALFWASEPFLVPGGIPSRAAAAPASMCHMKCCQGKTCCCYKRSAAVPPGKACITCQADGSGRAPAPNLAAKGSLPVPPRLILPSPALYDPAFSSTFHSNPPSESPSPPPEWESLS